MQDGAPALFLIAILPLPQTPALIFPSVSKACLATTVMLDSLK